MKIGVTILAIAAYIRKHWIEVAFLAGNTRVPALQRVAGFLVIKLGLAAYWLPGKRCMTLLTRNLHRPMWAGGRLR
jgi:hypothetical protein